MKRKSHNLNPRKISIEQMKANAIKMAIDNQTPDIRDRGVRGVTLINQLLRCYRIDSGTETFFEIENLDVKYACRASKNRDIPTYKLKHSEKVIKMVEHIGSDDDDVIIKKKIKATKGTLAMTIIVPETSDPDCRYSTKVTVTANCIMKRVGSFYTDLVRKLLYIYICSYIMKTRNFIALEGLQLHTPYTDMRCDHNNKIKIA